MVKVIRSITLGHDLFMEAKASGICISSACEAGIAMALKDIRNKKLGLDSQPKEEKEVDRHGKGSSGTVPG